MATFEISYSYGGCGSGTSSSYGWTSSEPRTYVGSGYGLYGTTQLSCSDPTPQETLRQIAINYASPYWRQGDIITINGVPYDPFLKWKCSGSPNYTCTQAADGTYNSQAECQAACIAPPPTTGSASFSSTPAGAKIFIDGSDQGFATPYTITNIPAGSHTFTLQLAGYNDFTGSFTITAGQTTTVSVSLTPVIIMKWKCSGTPNYTCTQAADGTYNSQAECQAACIAPPPTTGSGASILIGLLGIGVLGAVVFATRKRPGR